MATYTGDGLMVGASDEDEGLSPVEALTVALAEAERRRELGIRLVP